MAARARAPPMRTRARPLPGMVFSAAANINGCAYCGGGTYYRKYSSTSTPSCSRCPAGRCAPSRDDRTGIHSRRSGQRHGCMPCCHPPLLRPSQAPAPSHGSLPLAAAQCLELALALALAGAPPCKKRAARHVRRYRPPTSAATFSAGLMQQDSSTACDACPVGKCVPASPDCPTSS